MTPATYIQELQDDEMIGRCRYCEIG